MLRVYQINIRNEVVWSFLSIFVQVFVSQDEILISGPSTTAFTFEGFSWTLMAKAADNERKIEPDYAFILFRGTLKVYLCLGIFWAGMLLVVKFPDLDEGRGIFKFCDWATKAYLVMNFLTRKYICFAKFY